MTMQQRFDERFLTKGSECTWETYPEPEEIKAFTKAEIARAFEVTKVERKHNHNFKTFEGTCDCGVNRTQSPEDIGYNSAISEKEQKEKEYLNQLNK